MEHVRPVIVLRLSYRMGWACVDEKCRKQLQSNCRLKSGMQGRTMDRVACAGLSRSNCQGLWGCWEGCWETVGRAVGLLSCPVAGDRLLGI